MCHQPFCFEFSHLEYVLAIYNRERSKCKVRWRDYQGGCNALGSQHPFHHCAIRLPFGIPFTSQTAEKITKRTRTKTTRTTKTKFKTKKLLRTGPCENCGRTTPTKRGWYLKLGDKAKVWCSPCYESDIKRRLKAKQRAACVYNCDIKIGTGEGGSC